MLIDLDNPSPDVLEEYFAVLRALARPFGGKLSNDNRELLHRARLIRGR